MIPDKSNENKEELLPIITRIAANKSWRDAIVVPSSV